MPVIEEVRTVSSSGRLVVPWAIQQALGLDQGGPVCFRVERGVVTLHSAEDRWGEAAFGALADGDVEDRTSHLAELSAELETLLGGQTRDQRRIPERPARSRAPLW